MRIGASVANFDTVTEYLSWDHDRLDLLLDSVRDTVEQGDWPRAQRLYSDFARDLARHIRLEEQILLPLFEARTGIAGTAPAMRDDHMLIRDALGVLAVVVGFRDAVAFRAGLDVLSSLLSNHNDAEERVLYPVTDRVLPGREREMLALRLERE